MAESVALLAEAGCETPRLDAELLLADALGVDRLDLYTRDEDGTAPPEFADRIARRAAHEPVAYITGRRAFRNLELAVDPRVLIPRPDTETLVEVALGLLPEGARVHDVGSGSGAIALALKDERPDLAVSGSDASPDAVDVARVNAARLGLDVEFVAAPGLPEGYHHLVVANLPYVREDEWDGLAPEIRLYEPRAALVSGADGLDAIRDLVASAPAGTRVALEHAPGQAAAVRALLDEASTTHDLAGRERVTVGFVR